MRKKVLAVLLSILIIFSFAIIVGCGSGGNDAEESQKPKINSLDPESGVPGTIVQVLGKSFGPSQGNSVVHVGEEVAEVLSWSDEILAIRIPTDVTATDQGVSVLTADGESNQIMFAVTKKSESKTPDAKENDVEHPTPASAMLDFMKKKGMNTAGWTFAVVKISSQDPNWKIDQATKAGQSTLYFLLKKVNGSWTVVDDGNAMTAQELKGDGAPSDLWVQVPAPQPQPKTQLQVITESLQAQGIDSTGVSVYSYKQSTTDPTWELFYIDFPVTEQRADMIFALHQEGGQWVVKASGASANINSTPGLPADLKIVQ